MSAEGAPPEAVATTAEDEAAVAQLNTMYDERAEMIKQRIRSLMRFNQKAAVEGGRDDDDDGDGDEHIDDLDAHGLPAVHAPSSGGGHRRGLVAATTATLGDARDDAAVCVSDVIAVTEGLRNGSATPPRAAAGADDAARGPQEDASSPSWSPEARVAATEVGGSAHVSHDSRAGVVSDVHRTPLAGDSGPPGAGRGGSSFEDMIHAQRMLQRQLHETRRALQEKLRTRSQEWEGLKRGAAPALTPAAFTTTGTAAAAATASPPAATFASALTPRAPTQPTAEPASITPPKAHTDAAVPPPGAAPAPTATHPHPLRVCLLAERAAALSDRVRQALAVAGVDVGGAQIADLSAVPRECLEQTVVPGLRRAQPDVVVVDFGGGAEACPSSARAEAVSVLKAALARCCIVAIAAGDAASARALKAAGASLVLRPPVRDAAFKALLMRLSHASVGQAVEGVRASGREGSAAQPPTPEPQQQPPPPTHTRIPEVHVHLHQHSVSPASAAAEGITGTQAPRQTPSAPRPPHAASGAGGPTRGGGGAEAGGTAGMGSAGAPVPLPTYGGYALPHADILDIVALQQAVRGFRSPPHRVAAAQTQTDPHTVARAAAAVAAPQDPACGEDTPPAYASPPATAASAAYTHLLDTLRGCPSDTAMQAALLDFVQSREMQQRTAMALLHDEMGQLVDEVTRAERLREALLTGVPQGGDV